jgi:hypothetical protein
VHDYAAVGRDRNHAAVQAAELSKGGPQISVGRLNQGTDSEVDRQLADLRKLVKAAAGGADLENAL